MFYNWQHRDIQLTLFMTQGDSTIMYSRTGQKDFTNNIYSAVPMSEQNSIKTLNVSANTIGQIDIPGSECYQCWYFVKVVLKTPSLSYYRISLTQVDDNSASKFREVSIDQPV